MFKKWPKNCRHRISVKAKLCFDGSVCGIERIPRHVVYISISYRSTLKSIEWLLNCWLKSNQQVDHLKITKNTWFAQLNHAISDKLSDYEGPFLPWNFEISGKMKTKWEGRFFSKEI